ncbi:hypothetical protein [Nonomuraea sp. NPDC049309]|mgnify:CR=1 FL=1|uniref:hypothetical protein n=1 Tax=Nonomuraea sp. NPDC049309 TaxID=3364350 RepID=UPI0037193A6C
MERKNSGARRTWLNLLTAFLGAGLMLIMSVSPAGASVLSSPSSASEPICRIGDPCETEPPPLNGTLDASGCTGASGGTVCGAAIGTARYVQGAYVRRTALGAMCQPSGRYYVYDTSGSLIDYQEQHSINCHAGPVMEFNFTVRKQYPNSARTVCLGWYEEGVRIGRVCMSFPI